MILSVSIGLCVLQVWEFAPLEECVFESAGRYEFHLKEPNSDEQTFDVEVDEGQHRSMCHHILSCAFICCRVMPPVFIVDWVLWFYLCCVFPMTFIPV